MGIPLLDKRPINAHALIMGGSGMGKSMLLSEIFFRCIRNGLVGATGIDPHGSFVRTVVERCANPVHGASGREIRFFNPAADATFGLNPLEIDGEPTDENAHDAAQLVAAVIESKFGAAADETPRLARICYIACFIAAKLGLTLVEVVEFLSLGGRELREKMLAVCDNPIVRREIDDLHILANTQPARFLELVESLKNRLVRWLGDPRLRRILGRQHGLNPQRMMGAREIVLFDLSGLGSDDAAFVGTLLTSMYFAHARRRVPDVSAPHAVIVDEAESLLTADVARGLDQTRKFAMYFVISVQRLGQLRRNPEIADAVFSNTPNKVAMGISEPEAAAYVAETFAMGHVDLAEWKPGTERPVAVGSRKVMVKSTARGISTAESESRAVADSESVGRALSYSRGRAVSESIAHGESRSRGTSSSRTSGTSRGTSIGRSDGISHGSSRGATASHAHGTSAATGVSDSASLTLAAPDIDVTDAAAPSLAGARLTEWYPAAPQISSMSIGTSLSSSLGTSSSHAFAESAADMMSESSSHTSGESQSTSESFATAESESIGESITTGSARSASEAWGESESRAYGRAVSRAAGTSRASSRSEGESESFVTEYEWMPSQTYTLQEQLARMQGALQSLQPRECFVKVHGDPPLRLRTPDAPPAFKSAAYRNVMVPLHLDFCARRNPYLVHAAEIDAEIAARRARLLMPDAGPDIDLNAPEGFDVVEDPEAFARGFWQRRESPAKKPPAPTGRPPLRLVEPDDGDKTP